MVAVDLLNRTIAEITVFCTEEDKARDRTGARE